MLPNKIQGGMNQKLETLNSLKFLKTKLWNFQTFGPILRPNFEPPKNHSHPFHESLLMWYFHIWKHHNNWPWFRKICKICFKTYKLKVQLLKWFYNIFFFKYLLLPLHKKKYFNGIFLLLGNFFFKFYFCLKVRETK